MSGERQGTMNQGSDQAAMLRERAEAHAADWLARLDAPDASEADWAGLTAWLEADPEHVAAFDRAERLAAELSAAGPQLVAALEARPVAAAPRRASGARARPQIRLWRAAPAIAAAMAAAIAVAVVVGVRPPAPVAPTLYETAKGETRQVLLGDGSRIQLNSATRIAVALSGDARRVMLTEGEAAFQVAKDPTRPFLIAAADRRVRVVGTEFDVLNHDGRLRVTVREGVVGVGSIEAPEQAQAVLLKVGDQLDHRIGASVSRVSQVDPEAAFAWRRGDLIYRDQPLTEVVADLNRYFATPVRVIGPAGGLRFSGLLKIDTEEAVVGRLQAFLPIAVDRSSDAFTLRIRDEQAR